MLLKKIFKATVEPKIINVPGHIEFLSFLNN